LDPIRKSNPKVQRLILAAGLFIAWIGVLALLAATTSRPTVLSRAQFLVSDYDVIAQLSEGSRGPAREATVEDVHWSRKPDESLTGKKIIIQNLEQCQGWDGPGQYILPLKKTNEDRLVVAAPAMSPGFEPIKVRPRIYRATPETLRQLNSISKSK
jgi:hypothetical protein